MGNSKTKPIVRGSKMTSKNITERRNHLANLKVIRSTVEEAIKQVEKEIEEQICPAYSPGQIWNHADRGNLLVTRKITNSLFFTILSVGCECPLRTFEKSDLTYVGESIEVLKVGKE